MSTTTTIQVITGTILRTLTTLRTRHIHHTHHLITEVPRIITGGRPITVVRLITEVHRIITWVQLHHQHHLTIPMSHITKTGTTVEEIQAITWKLVLPEAIHRLRKYGEFL